MAPGERPSPSVATKRRPWPRGLVGSRGGAHTCGSLSRSCAAVPTRGPGLVWDASGGGAQGRVGRRATCERLSPQTSRQEKQGHRAFSRAPTSGPGEGGALNCPAGVCPEAVSPTGTPGGTLHIAPPWALF